jgi:methylphosphotriester-DNA--protein-cysteine methyltransferase
MAESQDIVAVSPTSTPEVPLVTSGSYVASKSGTKYHLPWCPGAKQIKEDNKIWFDTKEDAEKSGYAPAANCKGI